MPSKSQVELKAFLIVNAGIQPSEFDALTMAEVEAIVAELKRVNTRK